MPGNHGNYNKSLGERMMGLLVTEGREVPDRGKRGDTCLNIIIITVLHCGDDFPGSHMEVKSWEFNK